MKKRIQERVEKEKGQDCDERIYNACLANAYSPSPENMY
jgi:hypothetical protein